MEHLAGLEAHKAKQAAVDQQKIAPEMARWIASIREVFGHVTGVVSRKDGWPGGSNVKGKR